MRSSQLSEIEISAEYYSWLCNLIKTNQKTKHYWLLANALQEKKFEWSVANDDNRIFEARDLREKFCNFVEIPYREYWFSDKVSMLELLISLAYRCETIMEGEPVNMKMINWFWDMMLNVRLDIYTDEEYYDRDGHIVINQILDKIINRTYGRDGQGGLFPLKKAKKDQRKVELWYQMNAYLVENFY